MKQIIKYLFSLAVVSLMALVSFSCSEMHKDYEQDLVEYPELTISDFTPKTGFPNSIVTITGTNFGEKSDAARVSFNGIEVDADKITDYSSTSMTVEVPPIAVEGDANLEVQVWNSSATFADPFVVQPGAKVTLVQPESAYVGEIIELIGSGLASDVSNTEVIFFNQVVATNVISITNNSIKVEVPEGAKTGAVTINIGTEQVVVTPVFTNSFTGIDVNFNLDGEDEGWGPLSASGSWRDYDVADGVLKVNFIAKASESEIGSNRADFKNITGTLAFDASENPIVALKMVLPDSCKLALHCQKGTYRKETNSGNNVHSVIDVPSTESDVYYFDLETYPVFNTNGTNVPDLGYYTYDSKQHGFGFKIYSITSEELSYEVDWVKTFKSVQELQDYITNNY